MEGIQQQFKEEIFEVKTYITYAKCPICKSTLVAEGRIITTVPPKYPHRCSNCGHSVVLDTVYPITEVKHEKVETDKNTSKGKKKK